MIANYTEQGWEIITQRAHGLLAAQLAAHWLEKDRPQRWTETLIAVAEHDDAQTELEASDLLTPQGGPVNFKMKHFDPEHCQRLRDYSLSKSRYIALLTSMHMNFLYADEGKKDKRVAAFLKKEKEKRARWMEELQLSQQEVDRIYGLLEWCDAFSLLLCQNEIQPENRVIEISAGPDKKQYKLWEKKNGKLTVAPWPFQQSAFKVLLETRIIPQLTFKNAKEFQKCFLAAKIVEKGWDLEE